MSEVNRQETGQVYALVEARRVSFAYSEGAEVISGASLSVERGRLSALVEITAPKYVGHVRRIMRPSYILLIVTLLVLTA